MPTIAELVIGASVDPSGVKTGLDQALGFSRQFARAVDTEFEALGNARGAATTGRMWADALVTEAGRAFEQSRATMREQLFRGALSPQEFALQGKQAAQAFNATLLQGLGELRMGGDISALDEQMIVGSLKQEGLVAGQQFAAAFNTSVTSGMASTFATINDRLALTRTGLFSTQNAVMGLGRRFSSTGVMMAFALEGMAEGSESMSRRALRSLSLLGFAFGPEVGGLTLAIATAGQFMLDFFNKAQHEAEETRKKFEQEIARMANAGQSAQLEQQLKTLTYGQPYNAKNQLVATSPYAKGAFSGSIADLQAQGAILEAQMKNSNLLVASAAAQKLRELHKLLDPMIAEQTALETAILNVASQPAERRGILVSAANGNLSTAEGPDKAGDPYKHLSEHAQQLVTAYQQQRKAGDDLSETYKKLNTMFDQAGVALAHTPDQAGKAADALRKIREEIEKTITPLARMTLSAMPGAQLTPGATTPAFGQETQAADALVQRVQAMRSLFGAFSTEAASGYRQLAQLQEILTQRIAEEGGPLAANVALLRAAEDVQRALAEHKSDLGPSALPADMLAQRVAAAKQMEAIAQGAANIGAANAAQLEGAANAQRQAAITTIRGMIEATSSANMSDEQRIKILSQLVEMLDALGVHTKSTAQSFEGIVSGLHGLVDTAGAVGALDAGMRRTLDSSLKIVEAIKAARDAKTAYDAAQQSGGSTVMPLLNLAGAGLGAFGAITGALGGLVSMLGGNSAAKQEELRIEQEHLTLLKQNNDRLLDLSVKMAGGTGGESGMLEGSSMLAQAFAALTAEVNEARRSGTNNPDKLFALGNLQVAFEKVQQMTGDFSMTWAQFLQLVKDSGIQIADASGQLLLPAIDQLTQYFQQAAKAAAQLTHSLDDQKTLSNLMERVFGKTTDQDKLKDAIALIQQFAPNLGKMFDGLDATTAEGRAKIEAALQQLATMIANNQLTPDMLGGFSDIKQLIDSILGVQDALDGLAQSTNNAVNAMTNVPQGYKVAAAIFAATAPQGGAGGTGFGIGKLPTVQDPSGRTHAAGAISQAVATMQGPQQVIYQFGAISIDARNLSPDELFASVLKSAQRLAAIKFNDSTRWADIQSAPAIR